jgi:hypothetical protein
VIRVFQAVGATAAAAPATAAAPPAAAEAEPIVITTGPEVVEAVIVDADEDTQPGDVNGNIAGVETSNVPPAAEKGKSRRRQPARTPRQSPSSRRPAKKRNA